MNRILIVEDDPSLARLLDLTLALEGYATEVLADAEAALARLAGDPVDLVVLDVMPLATDTRGVLRALRSSPPWCHTDVLVLSAPGGDDRVWRRWMGVTDRSLIKPFALTEFRDVAGRALRERRAAIAAG